MNAKFTPGPWSVKLAKHPSDGAHYFGVGATVGTNEQRIIGCFGRCYENGFPVAEANARLIAAAPDMIGFIHESRNALKSIRAEISIGPNGEGFDTISAIDALIEDATDVIAKAEGKL